MWRKFVLDETWEITISVGKKWSNISNFIPSSKLKSIQVQKQWTNLLPFLERKLKKTNIILWELAKAVLTDKFIAVNIYILKHLYFKNGEWSQITYSNFHHEKLGKKGVNQTHSKHKEIKKITAKLLNRKIIKSWFFE